MELNSIKKTGTYSDGVDLHNDNYAKIGLELQTIKERGENEKGYYETILSLQSKFPNPQDGWQAYIADSASSTGYYIANVVNGSWLMTGAEAPAISVNLADYAKTGGSEKTVKEVETEIAQLAGDGMLLDERYRIFNTVYNSDYALESADVEWADGTSGKFTSKSWDETNKMFRGYEITYSDTAKVVQPDVTVENYMITDKPNKQLIAL